MSQFGSTGQLRILTIQTSERTLVSVSGPLDVATCGQLEGSLLAALASTDAGVELEVDVEGVDFADSTGVHTLLEVRRAAAERQVKVVLWNPGRHIRFLLDVLAVDPDQRPDMRSSDAQDAEVPVVT